jgi:transposase-like protein
MGVTETTIETEEPAMSIIVLKLPEVKVSAERPRRCPICKGEILQRWGGQIRQIRDHQTKAVLVYRYRCVRCRHSFRHYPEGVDQHQQSQRLRKLAALCWVMGLSYRGIAAVFAVFGVAIGRMSAWGDVQEAAEQLKRRRIWKPVRVLGLDGAYVLGWGQKQPVMVAVDLGEGDPVAIGYLDEHNPEAVRRWLEPIVKRLGVSVIVTDDLVTYKSVAEKLELEHQICQFHVRRWVGRTLRELHENIPVEWLWVLEEVRQLLETLPPDGGQRLFDLWKQVPERRSGQVGPRSPLEQLRNLLIRLSEHWSEFRVFDWQKDVPWTNNGTEQVIGRMKMRARTVRGYKTKAGMLAGLMSSGSKIA